MNWEVLALVTKNLEVAAIRLKICNISFIREQRTRVDTQLFNKQVAVVFSALPSLLSGGIGVGVGD